MEKSIPSIVGAWLAGTYDRDRPVGKAANDGIKSFLDTEDKVISFWRRCQMQILAYVQEAFQETPQTLSDERTVSPDDSLDKYNRVIGGSLSLVLNLLTIMDRGDFENHQEAYSNLLSNNKTLWSFVASSDTAVRRTTSQLLIICLDKQEEMIGKDIKLISHAFIVEGLCSSQSNSALKLLQALVKLTSKFPQAWTTAYKDKIPPLSRLRSFTKKGSQGGAPEFWPMLCLLLMELPSSTLPADLDGITDFLKTMRDGITGRGENRTNSSVAWTSYFEIAKNLGMGVLSLERFNQLLRNAVFPAFEQYVRPVAENSGWSMDMSSKTLAKAFNLFSISKIDETPQILRDEWQRLSDLIINRIILSRPEQLNEHANSETLIAEAHRWFGLQAEIIRCAAEDAPNGSSYIIDIMAGPCSSVIRSALAILVEGDGESCCAAVLLEAALRLTPDLVTAIPGTLEAIISFFEDNLPKLIISLSSKYLTASLIAFHSIPGQIEVFKNMWDAAVAELLANPDSTKKLHAIHTLTSNYDVSRLAQRNSGVQDYLLRCMSRMMRGELQDFALFESSLIFDTFSEDTKDQLVKMILISFDSEPIRRDNALHMLHVICQRRPLLLQEEDTIHLRVMTRLLSLTESSNPDTKAMANALKSKLGNFNYPNSQSNRMQHPILSIIRENLETVAPQSLR
jgi:E3 ubiquitin-protein ligase listerin